MGRTSAGLQKRDAGCGGKAHARTAWQIKRITAVHYLVSPPRQPLQTGDKPKLKITLSPAGSGDTETVSVRFFAGAARAVLYREHR
ncbi:hypothetical protein E7W33_06565 [Cronobacter sakazakii]|nr:hypothetical protein [Cronobacter sakazakii]